MRAKLAVVVFEFASVIVLLAFNVSLPSSHIAERILASTAQPTEEPFSTTPEITQRVETIQEPEATPKAETESKKSYVIAFVGDSMTETMGAALPYVYKELKSKYPEAGFSLYNYGIGSENIVEGISRFSLPYSYKNSSHAPLPELGADIIVVGSYSYNPITPFDKNEAWLLLADLVGRAKNAGKNVYILAEQAPINDGFGEGVGGVNWPLEITKPHTEKIIMGLKNAVGLAEALDVGLINVFEQSRLESSEYGNPEYVAKHDGIHYSEAGQEFSAKIITETIELP